MADAINRLGTIAISWSSNNIGRVSLEQEEDDRAFCPVLPYNPIDTVGTLVPMLVVGQVIDSTGLYRCVGFPAGGGAAACGACGSSPSKRALVAGMIEQNPFWDRWRGPNDKGAPHSLTLGELSGLLSRFDITVKTIWPPRRQPGDRSVDGYCLSQFEPVWSEHWSEDHTSTQADRIIRLPRR